MFRLLQSHQHRVNLWTKGVTIIHALSLSVLWCESLTLLHVLFRLVLLVPLLHLAHHLAVFLKDLPAVHIIAFKTRRLNVPITSSIIVVASLAVSFVVRQSLLLTHMLINISLLLSYLLYLSVHHPFGGCRTNVRFRFLTVDYSLERWFYTVRWCPALLLTLTYLVVVSMFVYQCK